MKAKKSVTSVSKLLVILAIPLLLFSINVSLLLNPFFLKWEYSKPDFPESKLLTNRERTTLSRSVLAYIKDITDVSSLGNTKYFNEKEIKHLDDVRILTNKLFLVHRVSGILLVYSVLFTALTNKKNYDVFLYIFLGCLATFVIGLLLLVLVQLDFDFLFIKFHEIIFPQGLWSFDPQDTLIQLYPERFWIDSAAVFLILVLAESFVLSAVSFLLMQRLKSKKVKIDV